MSKFSGSPTKSAKKFSNGTSNGGGRSLILNNKKGTETKQKQKLAKSLFFSEGEEEESEEDDDDWVAAKMAREDRAFEAQRQAESSARADAWVEEVRSIRAAEEEDRLAE